MRGQELWENSASAWIALMEKGDANRTELLDPVMLRLAGDVAGLTACDIGCGEGRFCRMLAGRGAVTTGIEPTVSLIEEARRKHPDGRYIEAGAEALPIADDSFDLVISYLVLIDVPAYRAAIGEMARIAKPGGCILVANLNSFCTTRERAWVRDDEGNPLHVAVDNYFEERAQLLSWSGITVINYHRPFEAYMQAFIASGLRLVSFEEPAISGNREGARVPYFHVMQWRKE
jgi:2-polyprenyl-3-methyl-5-hydroxy-6-metoxy-1,4-benzoquinol methylase